MTTLWWRLLLASYCICWCGADMTTMRKKQFALVADVFKEATRFSNSLADNAEGGCEGIAYDAAEQMRLRLATHLATMFKKENNSFDRTKFLLACGAAKRGDEMRRPKAARDVTGAVMVSADAARTLQNL
jgi:hypothetical protein